ncbi:MAG TPA: DUF2971 domain-containing protein [Alphaproteobacteria bacterium]|nr:DUF2971 domain-containing protein [Alphaproteobacteria bacterium]
MDKFALISFSDTYKNLPMWAYYASNFTGMCLEFDPCELTIGDLQNEELCPVAYAENALPSLTIADLGPDNLPSLIKPRLTRKRIEWAHEREWRYLTGADGKKHYVDDALRRVLLGPRVKPEHAKRICDALGNRPVEVLRGVIRGYDFSFQSIKPASSLQRSERVGAGNFSRHDALFEESKLELFLNVSIESLIQECERIKLRPNLDEICYINIATAEEDSIIIQTTFKLRGGHNTYYKNFYYDRNLKLLSIGNQ